MTEGNITTKHQGDDVCVDDHGDEPTAASAPTLAHHGIAQRYLTVEQQQIVAKGFEMAREGMDYMHNTMSKSADADSDDASTRLPVLSPDDISAYDCTGYHPVGGNVLSSKYNQYREGFIFSNGQTFGLLEDTGNVDGDNGDDASAGTSPSSSSLFEQNMMDVRGVMHSLALEALQEMEQGLELPTDYVTDTYGGTGTGGSGEGEGGSSPFLNSSQWHVKRYHDIVESQETDKDTVSATAAVAEEKKNDDDKPLWLPVHTDPSLVSVVLHDAHGQQPGGWGLEYHGTDDGVDSSQSAGPGPVLGGARIWKEIPCHGHGVATIMIGAAFGRLNTNVNTTGSSCDARGAAQSARLFPPVRHRVQVQPQPTTTAAANNQKQRMAMTYFLRPCPKSIIQPLPLPGAAETVTGADDTNAQQQQSTTRTVIKNGKSKPKQAVTFGEWYQRVSSRYGAAGQKNKPKPNNNKSNKRKTTGVGTGTAFRVEDRQTFLQQQNENNTLEQDLHTSGGAKCELLYPADAKDALCGKEQYLGGELGLGSVDGNGDKGQMIYAIPGHAKQVLKINPHTDEITKIGPVFGGDYKWLRSVQTPAGIIYGLPCHADCILRIDTHTEEITTFGHAEIAAQGEMGRQWKYHGGAICPIDEKIYCIPQFAHYVMKIDPLHDKVTFVGPAFPGTHKWYGGLLGRADGALYGIPQNATGVLKIQPSPSGRDDDCSVTLHGDFEEGGHKWHGGCNAPDGSIIGIPANANTILKIRPGPDVELSEFGDASSVRTGNHRSDGKYKYLGAVAVNNNTDNTSSSTSNSTTATTTTSDGYVYLMPSDSDRVVQVDTLSDTVMEIGGSLTHYEPMRHNKWQNGFYSRKDQAIYAIPLKGQTVLRVQLKKGQAQRQATSATATVSSDGDAKAGAEAGIMPAPVLVPVDVDDREREREPMVGTVGGLFTGLNKWEGGVMDNNGNMYCMPLNHKAVLKITPAGGAASTCN